MDINKIFGAFDSEKDDNGFPIPKFIKDIEENHPKYYLGMFKKLINNHLSYQKGLIQIFQSADPKLDMEDIKAAGENMLYNKAWEYIKNYDLEDEYSQKALSKGKSVELEHAFVSAIVYFENQEEYEKCAFLKKFLDFLDSIS